MKRVLGQMLCLAIVGLFLLGNTMSVGAEDQIELRMTWWGSQFHLSDGAVYARHSERIG